MINGRKVLGLIPARGGSTRIPRKNIKLLAGKPLIQYTFEVAKQSKYIDRLITVTDDAEIAEFSKKHKVEVPFLEPDTLAGTNVKDYDFFIYYLQELQKRDHFNPDILVQLRPTSPLRTVEIVDGAVEMLAMHPEADSVRTVTRPEQSPYKMYAIGSDGYLRRFIESEVEYHNMPDQLLTPAYKHVGYADVLWAKTLIEKKSMTGARILPLVVEGAVSGINMPEDWPLYEFLIQNRK